MAFSGIGYESLGSMGMDSPRSSLPSGQLSGQYSGPLSSRLDQQLSCAICLERYDEPRVLKCSHSFCRRCLVRVLEGRQEDKGGAAKSSRELVCPKCRDVTILSEAGVDALPINWDLMGVVDIFDDDDDDPVGTTSQPPPLTLPSPQPSLGPYCPDHNRVLDFFCESCDVLMCATCAVNSRCGHKLKEAKEVMTSIRSRCVDPLEIRYLRTNVAIDANTRMDNQFRKMAEHHKHKIRTLFQELRNSLNSREVSLIHAMDGIVNKKCTSLHTQCVQLKQLKEKLQAEKDHVSRLLDIKNNDYNVLLQREQIVSEVDGIITEADQLGRDPVEDIREGPECNLREELLQEANSFGEIFCTPFPAKFVASGAGLERAHTQQEAEFVVEAHDKYGQRAFKGGNTITVEITDPQGIEIPVSVTNAKRGKYVVRYTPQHVGYHKVSIMADSQNISNHQISLVAYGLCDYSLMIGPSSSLSRQHIPDISTVRSVCALAGGQLVFSDQLCLRAITTDGRLVRRAIGTFGVGQGQFNMPIGLTTNSHDEIFVADRQNHRIQRLSSAGKFLTGYGGPGSKPGSLQYPEDVAVTGERLFVADTGNNRVQWFQQRSGKVLGVIDGRGAGGHMKDPQGVAVDTVRGRLFVTDSGNNRLLCFSLSSPTQLLPDFGQNGEVPLISPTCVAVDKDGFVLVTSSKAHLLTLITPQGAKVKQLGADGAVFKSPYGICVDSYGNIIVADNAMPGIHILSTSHCH